MKLKVTSNHHHPLLGGSFQRRMSALHLDAEAYDVLKSRIKEIVDAHESAMAHVASLVDVKMRERREDSEKRLDRLYEEYRALVDIVNADYGRVIGRLDEYRATLYVERDALAEELAEVYTEINERERDLLIKITTEAKSALEDFKRAVFRDGKIAMDAALDAARTQMREPPFSPLSSEGPT